MLRVALLGAGPIAQVHAQSVVEDVATELARDEHACRGRITRR